MNVKNLTTGMIASAAFVFSLSSFANHSVIVEGETDFDGDGVFSDLAEDTDGDNVFATFGAALADINNNGLITCVTSGRFGEAIIVPTPGNSNVNGGNVTVEAAPGATCVIEAFFQGNDARAALFNVDTETVGDANVRRQNAPGAVIDTPANTQVTLRNLVIANWTDCVAITGDSRVLLENITCNNNIGIGVVADTNAFVNLKNSTIVSQGFRQTGGNAGQNFPTSAVDNGDGTFSDSNTPANIVDFDGRGVVCAGASTCRITNTTVSGSCRDGLTQADLALVILRGSSVSDSGLGANVCNGDNYAAGFDFSNFLPN